MIETLLLTLAPAAITTPVELAPAPAPRTTSISRSAESLTAQDDAAPDYEADIKAAGEDVNKLTELAEGWSTAGEDDASRAAYERIIELDENNETAHKGLGHHAYDDKWFETYAALSKHRRAEAKRMLEEEGKVRYGDEWVLKAEVPYRRMNWVKEAGQWVHPADAEIRASEAKLKADGWSQQDLTWIHPDDFDKWSEAEGKWTQWKVGEEWMSIEDANAHHAALDQWWKVPGERFNAWTTLDHDSALWAAWWADKTYADLVRIFGVQPSSKPSFLTLNGIDQYNVFAAGDPTTGRGGSEITGWSSVHYAFFADSYIDTTSAPVRYKGMGVCYWAVSNDSLKAYGQHAIRHAAAQSYIDAIDPSWDIISRVIEGSAQPQGTSFWDEKVIPLWMRFGGACYVERFFKDEDSTANQWWARDWAMANLRSAGGVRPFDQTFAFALDPADPGGSGKMITEAGLIMSFILDGECPPVIEAHQAFKAALKEGKDVSTAAEHLQQVIIENKSKFLLYSNMPEMDMSAPAESGDSDEADDSEGNK